MSRLLPTLCVLLSALLPLAGQTDPDRESSRKPGRSAWFACTSIPDGLENPTKVMAGGKITQVELPRYMTSDPVKIPPDGIIRIVREEIGEGDPAEVEIVVLAEARIPEDVREALIILIPLHEPEGDRIFSAQVQNLANFKGGDRMFINLSKTGIRVQLGDSKVAVPPEKAEIYEAPNLSKATNIPIMYSFYHPERKEWKILSASTVVLRPTRREINVFNEGSRLGKIKKHKILFPLPVENP